MTGALGAGLVSMVASLTVGKEKYAGVQGEIQALLDEPPSRCAPICKTLVQRDTEVYGAVSVAMKLPRDTERAEGGAGREDAGGAARRRPRCR